MDTEDLDTVRDNRGKQKLAEARSTTLHELRAKAEASNLPEDAQAANDFENKCVRFEKKLHDLELTRMISLQTAPQIRMIQNNDTALVEKIQTSVLNTIPLWKNQMVLTLGIENSRRAMEAQRQVTDMTNALLQKNADICIWPPSRRRRNPSAASSTWKRSSTPTSS